jgi:predicted nucleic acid-binding protein
MRIILDANEYVFGIGSRGKPWSRRAVVRLQQTRSCELFIVRTIADEVQGNLTEAERALFFSVLSDLTVIDEEWVVAPELKIKYETMGLKAADALIAAYAEHVAADYLVTENRHFLSRREELPFGVVSAEEFVKMLEEAGDD